MGKLGAKSNNQLKDNNKQAYFLYPDGVARWGINVRINGVLGVEVEKDAETQVSEHFSEETIKAFLNRKEENKKLYS